MKSPIKPRAKAARFNLFFLEMIIVLLFFSIAAAVILNSFAAADSLAKKSRRTEAMAFCAQSAAEIFSETGDLETTAKTLFGEDSFQTLYIDTKTGKVETTSIPLSEDCVYSPNEPSCILNMSVDFEEYGGGVLKHLHIIIYDGNSREAIYGMTSGAYIPDKEEAGLNE